VPEPEVKKMKRATIDLMAKSVERLEWPVDSERSKIVTEDELHQALNHSIDKMMSFPIRLRSGDSFTATVTIEVR
jgi:hypothetical protein